MCQPTPSKVGLLIKKSTEKKHKEGLFQKRKGLTYNKYENNTEGLLSE